MRQPDSTEDNRTQASLQGMRAFYVLWAGQFVSIFATRMTRFAITLWAWDLTGTATGLVLVAAVTYLPNLIFSPFTGALVDRWDRKLTLALSDAGAALSTVVLFYLFLSGQAQIWHLYLTGFITGAFGTFQYPAYSAVVTTMVPKEHYSRANGMRSVVGSASGILAPLLAGAMLAVVEIPVILIIDLVTFVFALGTLLLIHIPQPAVSEEGQAGRGSLWQEVTHGFRYILDRESLTAIFIFFTAANIFAAFGFPMMSPTILAKTGDDSVILGLVQSAGSVGFLAGGVLMSVWAGSRRRIHLVNSGFILWGILGAMVFGPAWSLPLWLIGSFFMSVFNPIINSAYIAILQSKVAPDLQGRVFALEEMISTASFPIGQVVAGVLADQYLEPAMAPQGSLAPLLGPIFGTGEGAGMGLMIGIGGLLALLTGIAGFLIPSIRYIETRLPDHPVTGISSP
ncbi:MAG: MFS transporter [Anaerolineales bacterium]